jgi:hypothetical protein
LSEKEGIELANALLKNADVTNLEFETAKYTNLSAEAMAKYVRTSKSLQRIRLDSIHWYRVITDDRVLQHHEEMFCCFLPALQESTSLKELHINFPHGGGLSDLALENMLTHTQSLQSLSLSCPDGLLEDLTVAATSAGLEKNTTLRELTLRLPVGAKTFPPF